ncbi:MAG: PqiC family protein [Azospirillaceae bacterium]|nr:PqiC family protein [Azospirillaceae bacterium]
MNRLIIRFDRDRSKRSLRRRRAHPGAWLRATGRAVAVATVPARHESRSWRAGLIGLSAFALGLAACTSSAPVHYFTLLAPAAASATAGPPAPFLIDVLPVGIPAQLDQPQLVVRQGDSGVTVLDGERWAGPLDDEFRSALSTALTGRLRTQDIADLAAPAGKPVLRIKLEVRRFDAWPGQRVQLDADWSLGFADDAGNARLACHGQFDEPASGGYPELVEAEQRAVAKMAARIAGDASGWARSRNTDCPIAGSSRGDGPPERHADRS